jgi:hypothetical protein
MGHADWLVGFGRFEGLDPHAAMEAAVLGGWIGVSISPVGESVGIRVRPGAAEKKAARALGRIFRQDGMWEREVYTDFAPWNAKKLYNQLVRTGCNTDIFPDRKAEIRFVEAEIAERSGELSRIEAILSAQAGGSDPDHVRIGELVREIEDLCGRAYGHIEKISPVGDGITDIEDMRQYCREQISIFDEYSAALLSAVGELPFAFAGTAKPAFGHQPDYLAAVDRTRSDLEIIEQLKKIELELSAKATAGSVFQGFAKVSPELGKAYGQIERFETCCGVLVSNKLRLLEKDLVAEDATSESLGFSARYYIGHELARTFSVTGRYYVRDLREALAASRAAQPLAPSP